MGEESDEEDGNDNGMGQKPKDILAVSKQELLQIQKKQGKGVKKVSNKTKKRVDLLKRRLIKQNKGEDYSPASSALYHLYDPQNFGERLFALIKKTHEKFDIKLMMINLVARLISTHNLLLLNFYPFLQRYLQPHQKQVSAILSYVAEATHELVPHEDLEPLVRTICYNFITDRNSGDAISAGLNTVRIMASRVPMVLQEDMVHDLVQYKNHKDKGVAIAARALIEVYRIFDPMKLMKKERGKGTDLTIKPKLYGTGGKVHQDMPGIELLAGSDTSDEDDDDGTLLGDDDTGLLESGSEDDGEDEDDDEGGAAEESEAVMDIGWTAAEHEAFMEALSVHGEAEDVEQAWIKIGAAVGGAKSVNELKGHAEWHFGNLQRPVPQKRVNKRKMSDLRKAYAEDGDLETIDEESEEEVESRKKLRSRKRLRPDPDEVEEEQKEEQEEEQEEGGEGTDEPVLSGMDRILTQEEHDTIKRRALHKQIAVGLGYKGDRGVVRVSHEEIEGYKKKVKLDREQKIAMAQEGREDRGKYGVRKEKGGKQMATNKEKQKTKLYLMLQKKQKRTVNKMTINQKKKGTGFMSRLKDRKGKKTQLGKKAHQVMKKQKKTR